MAIIVQKFGGTSVADAEKIRLAAKRVIKTIKDGYHVVVVASARGKQTDELIADALELNPDPPHRELDQLISTGEQQTVALFAMALEAMGYEAISLTGNQIKMLTDRTHTKARIKSISADRMRKHLDKGRIVLVAGFQGINEDGDILDAVHRACSNELSLSVESKFGLCAELTEQPSRRLVHLVNYLNRPVKKVKVSLRLPKGRSAESVTLASPEHQHDIILDFEEQAGLATFTVPKVKVYEIAVVALK